mmetsp:Transcript_146344/g.469482  ORF Transcript_146344/g.469482 Transcript_146344/m.469482 type:complete len:253 (+) Transcript_146344:256-1014(+)
MSPSEAAKSLVGHDWFFFIEATGDAEVEAVVGAVGASEKAGELSPPQAAKSRQQSASAQELAVSRLSPLPSSAAERNARNARRRSQGASCGSCGWTSALSSGMALETCGFDGFLLSGGLTAPPLAPGPPGKAARSRGPTVSSKLESQPSPGSVYGSALGAFRTKAGNSRRGGGAKGAAIVRPSKADHSKPLSLYQGCSTIFSTPPGRMGRRSLGFSLQSSRTSEAQDSLGCLASGSSMPFKMALKMSAIDSP